MLTSRQIFRYAVPARTVTKKALLVGKTLTNVFHCDIAEIRFVGKLVIIQTYQRIECHLSNTVNLRPLTPHIMPRYTRIMAVVSWP